MDASSKESEPAGRASRVPAISLPKGGGAIRGIGEKFAANPVTGTGSMTVPIATSPARGGFGPQLSLSYDSGAGNGPFGFGWSLSLPSITRKSDKGLPQYLDAEESDVFILSGVEDLVPAFKKDQFGNLIQDAEGNSIVDDIERDGYTVRRYLPRVEGLFARIERWTRADGDQHWRSISKDNILTLYGKDDNSRIADPDHSRRVFSWLICGTLDDKGNVVSYGYKPEDGAEVDLEKPQERNRGQRDGLRRKVNRYIKHIRYGNRIPLLDDEGHRPRFLTDGALQNAGWMFEVVFDYGEHHPDDPKPNDDEEPDPNRNNKWLCRHDPFSSYRAGFEVRTYRLAQRVLMFHHFPNEQGIGNDCLVRSTDFVYRDIRNNADDLKKGHPIASFIASVTQSGYKRAGAGGYLKKSVPPLEFEYSKVEIQEEVHEIDAESLENLPVGLDGSSYQWVDLDGEGVSGILTEQTGEWFYKPNLGNARFGPLQTVARKPSMAALGSGRQQLIDLAGDGQLDLAEFAAPAPGFFERTDDGDWELFKPFPSLPDIRWDEPNLRFVDLNGDGHADVLITEHQVFTWHLSLAEDGFGPARRVYQSLDEERGPQLVFADGSQSIYLADMCGDGLTDLVRIRNSEVCYWPNLGYGRFGAKVAMDNAPWFDNPDQFNQRRIRLADIDGSGSSDIIYLGRDGVRVYFNESGNGWSAPRRLSQLPDADDFSEIITADLLGNGTACLVWSSPLPPDARRPMRYIDLMGGLKPHLLIKTVNNLGSETLVDYAPSTRFYLEDKAHGTPWITRIPFPVHVVERVETRDQVSRNRFVTRYSYHHGFFDGVEREFRGFGLVEQLDTEEIAALGASPMGDNIDAASHVPPVLTKSWFHTGVYLGRDRVSNFFAGLLDANDKGEYYREPDLTDDEAKKLLLDDTVLPLQLTLDEEREACRALKGSMLRQEIYALDGTDRKQHPYLVTEQNFTVERVQPRAGNRHAVFFTHAREAIAYHYERNPADPRISHAMTLEVDAFGNVLKELAIGYGRRLPDPDLKLQADQDKQTTTLITYTENNVTNAIDDPINEPDNYRASLPSATLTYELTGFKPAGGAMRFGFDEWVKNDFALVASAIAIAYEETADQMTKQKRAIEHLRTIYRKNDLTDLLPLGTVEYLGLPGESYKLAFTRGLLDQVYKRPREGQPPEDLLVNPADVLAGEGGDRGGYLASQSLKAAGLFPNSDPDDHWWIPAGRIFYSTGIGDSAAEELDHARRHFFLAKRYRDPFGQSVTTAYDAHDLLMIETLDPLGNRVTVGERDAGGNVDPNKPGNDYRVLQPRLVTDINRNRTEVAFDILGMVAGTAVKGKDDTVGDTLGDFEPDLTQAQVDGFYDAADPHVPASDLLTRATTRIIYDLDRFRRTRQAHPEDPTEWLPVYAATLARETHASDPLPPQGLKIQINFSYSDGFGREIQKKIQAEPGPLVKDGPVVSPRWVGSGWTIFNNKGKPVRQYEPFFSQLIERRHRFEFGVQVGVSPILFYDPVERVVATLHPNHTYEKVVFDPWRQKTYDVNDTVLEPDPKNDPDAGSFFRRLPDAEYLPTWLEQRQGGALGPEEQAAANKAAAHANTPTVAYFDTLGRPFMTVADNGLNSSGNEQKFATRTNLDIEGNQRAVIDALDRVVMIYDYDMLGNRIHQASMEAGERWMLNDVTGKPIRAWDSRDHQFRTTYDALRRPADSFLTTGANAQQLVGRTVYGETRANPETNNLRGKVVQLFDQAGVVTSDNYDFKGNSLSSSRRIAVEYKATLDWSSNNVPLEAQTYTSSTRYDALNRPTEMTAPDNSVIRPGYNEANLLEKVVANLRGAAAITAFVNNIDYNAKGQRELIEYGNGVNTAYSYDPLTFHLTHLQTLRGTEPLQDLRYTYDPVGNITSIRDDAQQTIYFRDKRVEPSAEYTYDAIYRLIEATGREHLGQIGEKLNAPTAPDAFNGFHTRLDHPGDGKAMGTYVESYLYDAVGNFLSMQHRGSDPAHSSWTRAYTYDEASLIEPAKKSNRLSSTTVGSGSPEVYPYDAHGNMTRMSHLPLMQWDYRDQLQATAQQVVNNGTPETTWYVYDSAGQRVRKVTDNSAVAGQPPSRKAERLYLGGFEIHREYGSNGSMVTLERETLHVMDDKQRIALIETRTQGDGPSLPQLIRFQYSNHLGSASLELDDQAQIISYEEYFPYGSTSYQAVRNQTEAPKRYRYTGKERDEETDLYYHGARYCVPWIGRWTACDSAGMGAGPNAYTYAYDNPLRYIDPNGRAPTPNERRFGAIFNELGNHAETLIRAFTDPGISDQGSTVMERTISILVLTGGDRPSNPDYLGFPSAHFNKTVTDIGTGRGSGRSGDTGFRPELRDSLEGIRSPGSESQHLPSSNQIGHFLTAVDIGIQAQILQGYVDEENQFQREHPYLAAWMRGLSGGSSGADYYAAERNAMLRGMVGHELIPDREEAGSDEYGYGVVGGARRVRGVISAVWEPTEADVQNFLNGRLDLIHLNTSQTGNTYQDLLLSWIGYQFGVRVQQGAFATNTEAARWLTMMLTDSDLASVPQSDPFYQDAQKVNAMLNQVRPLTQPLQQPPPPQQQQQQQGR